MRGTARVQERRCDTRGATGRVSTSAALSAALIASSPLFLTVPTAAFAWLAFACAALSFLPASFTFLPSTFFAFPSLSTSACFALASLVAWASVFSAAATLEAASCAAWDLTPAALVAACLAFAAALVPHARQHPGLCSD